MVSQASFGMFLQDSWRVRNNLTISWGLRYDLTLPIHEKHDLLGNFDPTAGLVQVGKQISAPYNTDHHDLGPRLAFIWDPRGDGRTVVRAGGGVIYEIPHISVYIGQNGTAANGLSVIPTGAAGRDAGRRQHRCHNLLLQFRLHHQYQSNADHWMAERWSCLWQSQP